MKVLVFAILLFIACGCKAKKHRCYDICNCNNITPDMCKQGQIILQDCKCCYFCMPAHLRCMGSGISCLPVECNGTVCWCYQPQDGKRVGSIVPLRPEYAYVGTCEELWYFVSLHQKRAQLSRKEKLAPAVTSQSDARIRSAHLGKQPQRLTTYEEGLVGGVIPDIPDNLHYRSAIFGAPSPTLKHRSTTVKKQLTSNMYPFNDRLQGK